MQWLSKASQKINGSVEKFLITLLINVFHYPSIQLDRFLISLRNYTLNLEIGRTEWVKK